jgi:hypothetical protein
LLNLKDKEVLRFMHYGYLRNVFKWTDQTNHPYVFKQLQITAACLWAVISAARSWSFEGSKMPGVRQAKDSKMLGNWVHPDTCQFTLLAN